ncbi:MAG: hypothetical protein AAF682_29420 [Planctomycetota bacterium]
MFQRFFPLAASLALAAAPHADVLLVDGAGGPGAFIGIQGAILAASEGDTIVVEEGDYAEFEVVGKSLSIVAEEGALVRIVGAFTSLTAPLEVRDLAADQSVTVRGLVVYPDAISSGEPAVQLRDNAGVVLLEDVQVEAYENWSSQGLLVEDCDAVILSRCSFLSGQCVTPCPGGRIADSSVSLYDTSFVGSEGIPGSLFAPVSAGGAGLSLSVSSVFAAGCSFTGGQGGPAEAFECQAAAGDGFDLGSSTAVLRDCVLSPGQPGEGGLQDPPCPDPAGEALTSMGGTLQELTGEARSFEATPLVREGELLVETFTGPPDDFVFLAFAGALEPAFLPAVAGDFALAAPFGIAFKGQLDASGTLVDPVPIGELGPGVLASQVRFQAIHLTAVGAAFVSGPSSTVLLDGSL